MTNLRMMLFGFMISNINRVLRIYRDLHILVSNSDLPSEFRNDLLSALDSVEGVLLKCLSYNNYL